MTYKNVRYLNHLLADGFGTSGVAEVTAAGLSTIASSLALNGIEPFVGS
jgi:hypothetical protein